MIDKEEFEAWLAHPVTVALMMKCGRIAEDCRERWLGMSWALADGKREMELPMQKLAYLRGKADAFVSVGRLEYRNLFKEEKNTDERDGL